MALSPAGFLASRSLVATWDLRHGSVARRCQRELPWSDGEQGRAVRHRLCAAVPDGSDAPDNCRIKSFTTLDISGAIKIGRNFEVFGSIANVLDAKPPSDFETYGAIGYNQLDYSGAIGRYFRVGLKYTF